MDGPSPRRARLRIALAGAGLAISGYAAWALWSGSVVSTWGSTAGRSSPIFWITVAALLVVGIGNVLLAVFGGRKQR